MGRIMQYNYHFDSDEGRSLPTADAVVDARSPLDEWGKKAVVRAMSAQTIGHMTKT